MQLVIRGDFCLNLEILQISSIVFVFHRSTANVEISSPQLYLNCVVGNNETMNSNDVHCVNEQLNSMEKYHRNSPRVDCSWRQARVEFQQKEPLRADIPVGDSKDFPPVLYATIILSWAVSLYTVFFTQSVPRRINSELNQQRQQKTK